MAFNKKTSVSSVCCMADYPGRKELDPERNPPVDSRAGDPATIGIANKLCQCPFFFLLFRLSIQPKPLLGPQPVKTVSDTLGYSGQGIKSHAQVLSFNLSLITGSSAYEASESSVCPSSLLSSRPRPRFSLSRPTPPPRTRPLPSEQNPNSSSWLPKPRGGPRPLPSARGTCSCLGLQQSRRDPRRSGLTV